MPCGCRRHCSRIAASAIVGRILPSRTESLSGSSRSRAGTRARIRGGFTPPRRALPMPRTPTRSSEKETRFGSAPASNPPRAAH
eukprot:31194-Pelagococcus_subviridis.AAC.10